MTQILFLNSQHLILPPARFFLSLLMKMPLQTFTYFSLPFCIYYINNTYQYHQEIGIVMQAPKKSSKTWIWLGFSLVLGSGLAYYRVSQINKALGLNIVDYSLKTLREELAADNEMYNNDNSLHFSIEEVSNQLQIAKKRAQVYFSRFLYAQKYQHICKQVNKLVILPLLSSYQKEKMFEYLDIIQQFKQKKEFNNKLALQLSNIQKRNLSVREDNRLLLYNFYQLQQKLLTAHLFELSQQSKDKIDVLYSYFKQKERLVESLLSKSVDNEQESKRQNEDQRTAWIDQSNYGFKMQYI